MENLSAEQAYDYGISSEAYSQWCGTRWKVTRRPQALLKLKTSEMNDVICLAYQSPSNIPGMDIEHVYAQRIL